MASDVMASQLAASDTSTVVESARPPADSTAATVSPQSLRSAATMAAPSAASASA